MNVTITNKGAVAVPVSSSQDKGFAVLVEPKASYMVDSGAVTIVNVGDNPSAAEEFVGGISELLKKLGDFIAFWRERNEKSGDSAQHVAVSIQNKGLNGLRVLLGSNMNEVQVTPGGTYEAAAAGYVEIRELGT